MTASRGYVVVARRSQLKAIGGKYVPLEPEYLVTTRGLSGSWDSSIQRATVFDQETATRAVNDYYNKRALAGTSKSIIPDPLGRIPHTIDTSGRRAIDASNYFWNTYADFELVAQPGPEADQMWSRLKSRGRLDHVSDYGSQYLIIGDMLYRYADHWGSFATVTWNINPWPKALPSRPGGTFTGKMGYAIGRVPFSQMRLK